MLYFHFPDVWMLAHSEGKMEDTVSDGMDTKAEAGTGRVFAGKGIEDLGRHIFDSGGRRGERGSLKLAAETKREQSQCEA